MRFDSASVFYLWILNEVKAVQVNTITNVMQIVPEPGDQRSGSFVAELQIIGVTFSSVRTCSHSLAIFWGRKGSSSQWDRLYLPGLSCAKIGKPGRNPDLYLFFVLWVAVWMAFLLLHGQRRPYLIYLSVTVTIAPFFAESKDGSFFCQIVYVKCSEDNMFPFHPFFWRNLAAVCWVLGRLANGSNPCSRFILFGCLKREIKN